MCWSVNGPGVWEVRREIEEVRQNATTTLRCFSSGDLIANTRSFTTRGRLFRVGQWCMRHGAGAPTLTTSHGGSGWHGLLEDDSSVETGHLSQTRPMGLPGRTAEKRPGVGARGVYRHIWQSHGVSGYGFHVMCSEWHLNSQRIETRTQLGPIPRICITWVGSATRFRTWPGTPCAREHESCTRSWTGAAHGTVPESTSLAFQDQVSQWLESWGLHAVFGLPDLVST